MKLLLHNHNYLGDALMMTCGIRDLKLAYPDYKIMVDTDYPQVWENNPYIEKFSHPDAEYNIGAKIVTQGSKTNGLHFATAFRICLEDRLKISISQGPFKPDLHLNYLEKNSRLISEPYWIINIDCSSPYGAKRWPPDRWQSIVDLYPWILFVQIGKSSDNKYLLKGINVCNFIDKTHNLRDLFCLYNECEGSLGLISSQMHLAAAFDKPCIVVAGAREPATFESYQTHRFIHNIGALPCAKKAACWKCALESCKNRVNNYPKCMYIIGVQDVRRAIDSYYNGGLLEKPKKKVLQRKKPVFKLLCNAHVYGGAERSCIEIAKMMHEAGYLVEFSSRRHILPEIQKQIPFCHITNIVTNPCDILLFYASDMVFDFDKEEFTIMNQIQATRKIMALTYKIGKSTQVKWAKNWDLYLFLSSDMRDNFMKIYLKNNPAEFEIEGTSLDFGVLPPPIDLTPFYRWNPDYSKELTIVRHSSQGDNKYPKNIGNIIKACNKDINWYFMPGPTFIQSNGYNIINRPINYIAVNNFLANGNCFWYLLPQNYTDQGPRVVMEAMAAGLPCIVEDRDGAKDRVTSESGWLVNKHEEVIKIINSLNPTILKEKGQAARERAKKYFVKEDWIKALIE